MAADQAEEAAGSAAEGVSAPEAATDSGAPARSVQKVELDLDDAPFLEDEEEVQPEPPKPAAPLDVEAPPEAKPGLFADKKKLMILGAAALLLLIAAGVAAKFLLFKGTDAKAPEHAEQAAHKEQAPENATEAAAPELPEIQIKLDPFWVEQKGQGDEVRFLIVRMLLGTRDKTVVKEMETKLLPMRNAIFYYLKNKDVQFLTDEQNVEKLKKELLLVINQYLSGGSFDTLMFEEYVVK